MNLYLRLLTYTKPYWFRMIVALIAMLLVAGANLYVPWVIKDIIDKVLMEKDMYTLNLITISIILVYFFRGIFFYTQTYLMSYVGQSIVMDIRGQLYKHFQRLSLAYFERKRTGTVMSYVTNDVAAMQSAMVDNLIDMVTEGSILIGSIILMFMLHWKLTLLTLITFPLVAYAINYFGRKMRKASFVVQERAADITSVLQETLSAVRVIKSFVREDYEINRFAKQNHYNLRANMKTAQVMAVLTPTVEMLAAIGVTIIIWYGGKEVIDGDLTAGALIAFLMYVINLSNPIKRLSRVYGNIQKAMAAAQRVFEVLDTKPDIEDAPNAKELPYIEGSVTFKNATFEYAPGQIALNNINLSVKPGEMVALVGPSGSGKTTMANLIPRFYDLTSGELSIDQINVKDVTIASLREQIGIVPQETVLFNGTVYENILYGRLEATETEVIEAAVAANAHRFIIEMENGYHTQIGERGAMLSGGQRQRIAIARAILKNPRILILDEATSALDTESEKIVQEALDKLMIGRTSFVIAHRLSTVRRANMIIVLDKGVIVEYGTHQELIERGGLYAKLNQVQSSQTVQRE